ncbi:phage tail protein [Sedimenticola selenatireducens]|uniref:Phage tail protein n=1 Tax=Sedimenticola selenatireducens TaxID=191960 RepID=A0A2N6CT15_9GAMM|nr:phage tail protein [Sedimenticola selenatireducens]PLX60261.1 MAG: phage tail protein [Sedimenticola selenatireducens]
MPVIREDPYGGYNFLVTINGVSDDGNAVKGAFTEASGLEVEVPPIEYRNGNEDITVRKIPGLKKFTNISLKRGTTGDIDFWNWILRAMNGEVLRAEGSIALLDENRDEVLRWNFKRAWPCKYTGPGLNATNNEISMETLEICHEGLEIDGQA